MAGTVVRFGRYRNTADADIARLEPGEQLAYIADSVSGSFIVYRLGAWMGRWSGSPYTRIFMAYTAGPSTVSQRWPGDLIRVTDQFQPGTVMQTWDGGAMYERNVTPFVTSGGNFAFGVTSYGGQLGVGMRQAAAISGQNESFYRKSSLGSSYPSDPVEGSKSNEGHMAVWAEAEVNVKPNNPTGLTPTGTLPGTTLTPVFTSNFSDPNETLNNGAKWDHMARYRYRVVRVSNNQVMWNIDVAASASERTNKKSSRTYAGTALQHDVQYRFYVQHQDRSGAWSNEVSTTFTLQGLGSVEAPTNPSGFETSNQPGPVTAVYRHVGGLSANAVQLRLLAANGTVLKTSPVIAVSVANNGTISVPWASTTFGTLAYAGEYGIDIKARDTNNTWSTNWSPRTWFHINAAPNIPTITAPGIGAASSSRPQVVATATDPDGTIPTTYLEVLNTSNVVLATRTMTHYQTVGGVAHYRYNTTASDLATFGTFRFRTYSYDGYLYSGGSTTAAGASRSSVREFVYSTGPTVSITGPSSPVSTIMPEITWNVSFQGGATQNAYRVEMVDPDTEEVVYDTNFINSLSLTNHQIQPAWWVGGHEWNNGETFRVRVSVRDSNNLVGISDPILLTLTYDPIDPLLLDGTAIALPNTHGTNAFELTWEQSTHEDFHAYEIWRTDVSGDGVDMPGSTVRLITLENNAITTMLDAEVTSGTQYRWDLYHLVRQGNDILRSPASSWSGSCSFDGIILHMPFDPLGHRLPLRYGPPDAEYEPVMMLGHRASVHNPASGSRVVHFSPGHTHDPEGEFTLLDDAYSDAATKYKWFTDIWHAQMGEHDGRGHVVCWRDGRGGLHGRVYGILATDTTVTNIRRGIRPAWILSLRLLETEFTLGEVDEE